MHSHSFLEFLSERNREFISQISSESALGFTDTFRGEKNGKSKLKNCVLISFDPPMAYPPFAFNWNEHDVWYLPGPSMSESFFIEMETSLEQSDHPIVVFFEKKNVPHKRKIFRFIKNFKEQRFRNRPLSQFPKFILAEYKGPLTCISFTELKVGEE